MTVADEDSVITRFREKFSAPLLAECNTRTDVNSWFVNRVGIDNHIDRSHERVIAKERIEANTVGQAWLCKLPVLAIISAAAGNVKIDIAVRCQMHDGIERERKHG